MSESTGGYIVRTRGLVASYLEDARRIHSLRPRPAEVPSIPACADASPAFAKPSRNRVRQLVEPHLFYVVQLAGEYCSRDSSFEDVLAEGNMGLVEAAHRFDPEHGVKFLTYASWWIRKRILEFLVREGQSVRLTRYARERRRELRAVQNKLRQRLGREASTEELAQASGLDHATVIDRSRRAPIVVSLEQSSAPGQDLTIKDLLQIEDRPSPEDLVVRQALKKLVRSEIARLRPRERMIVKSRFGLDGEEPKTFQELGDDLGLSRERTRQIEREALERLRRRLHRKCCP